MRKQLLVSDFDGTMTGQDFYQVALARLPDSAADHWRRYETGELSHFAALASIFAELRVTAEEFTAMLAAMELEQGVRQGVNALHEAGWGVTIASAGCELYIKQLLADHGLSLIVHANPGRFRPESGLVMELPVGSPYFSPTTGINKGAIVRDLLAGGADVAYAGDGRPDLEPLLLLPARRRFARGWLAGELTMLAEPFTRFNRWQDIVANLAGGRPC